jgi:ribosome-associated translation inhibitor RaiA
MDVATRTSQLTGGELLEKDLEASVTKFEKFKKYLSHLTIEVAPEAKDLESNGKVYKAIVWVHGFKKQYQTSTTSANAKAALDESVKDMLRLVITEKEKLQTLRNAGARKIKQI